MTVAKYVANLLFSATVGFLPDHVIETLCPLLLKPITIIGVLCLSLGLMMLGILSVFLPMMAAESYGLPLSTTPSSALDGQLGWVGATGLRDFAIGVSMLMLLKKCPLALPVVMPSMLLIPVGDVSMVLFFGTASSTVEERLIFAVPHLFGVVALAVLIVLLNFDPAIHSPVKSKPSKAHAHQRARFDK
jgi:hypothetical protein